MSPAVKVTDSMGDHWVYDGVSVYPERAGGFVVPAIWEARIRGEQPYPSLDAAVDAIHTHLKGGGK